ncbi:hypothetical protein F511_45395 [Dorcoceras hygrometricum]|uniref:Uncharacterized protein n=1 Tax=Dorcoceras hygrometricum TaxID=472368 RepID=A0A2Z6ZW46_9LAMI|nr:hypothetical protein F511_45395 [Dorcoceras hygrometricum]
MAFKSSKATSIAALFFAILAVISMAEPWQTKVPATGTPNGSFGNEKDEKNECFLLCINKYLCVCDIDDRIMCCRDYCMAKCASGSCGDIPKMPCT